MKDLLRFDTIVAFCALLVSVITATVLGYQTHVVEEQYAAAIWPYLSIDTTHSGRSLKIALTNNGLGPALINSAQLFVDDRPAPGWTTVTNLLKPYAKHVRDSTTSVDGSTTIRPGDALALFTVEIPDTVPAAVLYKHRLAVKFCYCSLNDRCWNLETTIGSRTTSHPSRVGSCPLSAVIEA